MAEPQFDPIYTHLPDGAYLKHLELIQAVVARMAGNQFQCKAWSAAVVGAMVGFAVDKNQPFIAGAALVPALVFWGLDAWFLKAEWSFRDLYNAAINPQGGVIPMDLEVAREGTPRKIRGRAWWRPTVRWFHLPFVAAALAAAGFLWCGKACS